MNEPRTFVIGDLHFGHRALAEGEFGTRPWKSVEEHDEALIGLWNSVVSPQDTVYVLGDVAMTKAGLLKVERLWGHKRLVMGNHDTVTPFRLYSELFERVYSSKSIDGMCLSHVPVHPACLNRKSMQVNVHGHLHERAISETSWWGGTKVDPRYRCVSAEQINYRPMDLSLVCEAFGDLLS